MTTHEGYLDAAAQPCRDCEAGEPHSCPKLMHRRNDWCPTCHDTRVIRVPDPTASAFFPKPDRVYRCPDCTDREAS